MVIVSSGFHRTHVTIAAHEAAVRDNLRAAITGAYPTASLERALRVVRLDRGRIARLLERDEKIPPTDLRPLFAPELLDESARLLRQLPVARSAYPALSAACMRLYGSFAARELTHIARPGDVYHFRAGFGQASIRRAQTLGLITLCDHAAVHPALRHTGASSDDTSVAQAAPIDDPVGDAILSDIDAADEILVNSEFLRDMFVDMGYPDNRVHVVYLGVDETFLSYAREYASEPRHLVPLRLMFAGRFDRAKGGEVLLNALGRLRGVNWRLVIAGPIGNDLTRKQLALLGDPRVLKLGTINRRELARQMSEAAIFVFPSLSEGSARVVFEALACGCYVITTRDAGSIVEDGVHGAIVDPGDAWALAEAVTRAASDPDHLVEIGRRNALLIAEKYTQATYGAALASLYGDLATGDVGNQPSRSAQSSTFVAPNKG